MISPIKNPIVSSPYGYRTLNGKKQFHDGIDLISGIGDKTVYAISEGIVVYDMDDYAEELRWKSKKHSAGNYIIVKHLIDGVNYFARYLHLSDNFVTLNDKITEGQTLGIYADVGFSYGAHLHFDIYNMAWKKIDPTPILHKVLS